MCALLFGFCPLLAQTFAGGAGHTLAVCENGTLSSWGWNDFGQLGNASSDPAEAPLMIEGIEGARQVDLGWGHSLVLLANGNVLAFGMNNFGQIGDGTLINRNSAMQVAGLDDIIAVSAGHDFSLALKADGTVWGWGGNGQRQLGNVPGIQPTPVQLAGLENIMAISAGGSHTMALRNDGTLWTVGNNYAGQLGNGDFSNFEAVPLQVLGLSNVVAIAAGYVFSAALLNNGAVWAWGNNEYGQLGTDTMTRSNIPLHIGGLPTIAAFAVGSEHTLAVDETGHVWSWGGNVDGQLGNSTAGSNEAQPAQISTLDEIIAVGAGARFSLALKENGTLWSWGQNGNGQLGNGTSAWIGCGCDSIPGQVIDLCAMATSISEGRKTGSMRIFPNPCSGVFNVQSTANGYLDLQVINSMGVEVRRSTIQGTNAVVDLTAVPTGVYMISIRSAGEVITERLVKQ